MKSLFVISALFAGICACGGSEVLNRIPDFVSSLSVPQEPDREQTQGKSNNDRSEAALQKIHAIPIALVKYFAAEIKQASPEISDLKLSQSNLDKLEAVKQKLANIGARDVSNESQTRK